MMLYAYSNFPAGVCDRDLDGGPAQECADCAQIDVELDRQDRCPDCARKEAEAEAMCQGQCKEIDTDSGRCLDCDAQIVDARPTACIALTSVLPRSPVVCGGKDQERFKIRLDAISAEDFAAGRFSHWTLCKECLRITRGDK